MKVVIFTESKIGEGHYQAAKAVANELEQLLDKSSVTIISGIAHIHPLLEWLCIKTYFSLLRFTPSLWRLVYRGIHKKSKLLTVIFAWRLEKWLREEKPDIVICTHPACISALEYLKRKSSAFLLAAICTDFDFHPFFVSKFVDVYFVPHEMAKARLVEEFEIDVEKIYDVGIPVHAKYESLTSKSAQLSFDKSSSRKLNVLILGGGEGIGPLAELIDIFKPYQEQFHLTIVTGKNRKLYHTLSRHNYPFVDILGYVHNLEEWYKLVDFVLTKPGGLTVSEAIACGAFCILVKPIPGHEEANKDFLVRQGLAIYANNLHTLPEEILDLVSNEEYLINWRMRIRQFRKKQPAKQIAQQLILS